MSRQPVHEPDAASLTKRIDHVLDRLGRASDESAADAVHIGHQILSAADDN